MKQTKTVLHHYLGTGLQCQLIKDKTDDFEDQDFSDADKFRKGAIWELIGVNHAKDLHIPMGEGYLDGFLYRNEFTYVNFHRGVLPALHSMNRLTMPLENGEIPMLELAKIAFPQWPWSEMRKWQVNENLECLEFDFPQLPEYCFGNSDTMDFWAMAGSEDRRINNQLQLFQYLINNHFNCFGLSESEYIEKSTLTNLSGV